jgi:hypothetical protein
MKLQSWLRPRYSLRMLFAIITALALWLGWQESIIHRRQRLCRMLEEWVGQQFKPYNDFPVARQNGNFDIEYVIYHDDLQTPLLFGPPSIPWYRLILGDQNHYSICLPHDATPEEVQEFKDAFPEASVMRYPEKNTIASK